MALVLGFAATKCLDWLLSEARTADLSQQVVVLPRLLVGVGLGASFVLGANDVSNAIGVWSALQLASLLVAGFAVACSWASARSPGGSAS